MNKDDGIIFLTDKFGKRDRTKEIQNISFDYAKNIWNINFCSDNRTFHYKKENVKIIKNCLKDKQSSEVFDYLLQMAQFSDIKKDDGQNLLVKNLEKSRFVNEHSVLARYLNPKRGKVERERIKSIIFPFGCNNSQFKAVDTAMKNQVSIIQGPPGTGKTQTILNIIANLLVNNKTVLVVSNNNDATANVYEKLSSQKYGMDYICAFHGKRQNVEDFLKSQKQFYPDYLKEWRNQVPEYFDSLNEKIIHLEKYFEANEQISSIKLELSELKTEKKYFDLNKNDFYETKKLIKKSSVTLMNLLQKIQNIYTEKEKLSFFTKFKLRSRFSLGPGKFWKTDAEKVIETIKATYYQQKKKELKDELTKNEAIIKGFEPAKVYEECLKRLRFDLANKYSKNVERPQFKDGKEIFIRAASFADEYPVILSTTFSSRATIGQGTEFLFDYVIMDEASQVDVVTGALALSCAKNAIIVGDKMQLPNVIEEENCARNF